MDALLFFYIFFFTGFLKTSSCPTKEDITPCECFSSAFGNAVLCKNILNSEELIPAMQALANSNTKVNLLLIGMSSLLYLPEDIFQNIHIKMIIFSEIELMSLTDTSNAFKGLEDTLGMIMAVNIKTASQWDFSQLRNLRKLKIITLLQVILESIDSPLPHLPDLDQLRIDKADISFVTDDAFSNLPSLQDFSMKNNEITEMKRTMFPNPANRLAKIDLSRNKLIYLPRDFFDNMPSLNTVFLDKNKFTTLDENCFLVKFSSLHELSLTGNPFRCDCRMRWLVNIRFPPLFKGECSTPAALSGRSIRHLHLKSLWC